MNSARKQKDRGLEPPRSPGITLGHKFAVQMLQEMETVEVDCLRCGERADLDAETRDGRDYEDIVGKYLQRARAKGPEVERGFTMVLGDLLSGEYSDGGGPRRDRYFNWLIEGRPACEGN